jgi:tRNA(Ile)-lysidine synthetase-like protein
MATLAAGEERWWQRRIARLAQKLCVERNGGVELRASQLRALDPAVARRLVRRISRRTAGKTPRFEDVEKILALAAAPRGSGCVQLAGVRVTRSFDWLRTEPAGSGASTPQTVRVELPGKYQWPETDVCFELSSGDTGTAQFGDFRCARLKWKAPGASAGLELRVWKDGDSYRPWGRAREHSVKELFQQARVPSWRRKFWPIVTDGCNILWAREFGPAAALASNPGPEPSLCIWEEPQIKNPPRR